MASFMNKVANSVSNTAGSMIGRGNLQKLANSLNKALVNAKYRDYMKTGNTLQIISKNSRMALQIMASQNDQSRLVLFGNGQVGPDHTNSQFVAEIDPKNQHIKFKNYRSYIAFDNDVPCVIPEPINPKHNYEKMRARNEFRLHEIIGSDEYFSLESVYSPGRYLAVTPDGSITVSRNKTDECTYFCVHVIHVLPDNIRGSIVQVQQQPIEQPLPIAAAGGAAAATAPIFPSSSSANNNNNNNGLSSKQAESDAYAAAAATAAKAPSTTTEESSAPAYSSLFPKLPPQ